MMFYKILIKRAFLAYEFHLFALVFVFGARYVLAIRNSEHIAMAARITKRAVDGLEAQARAYVAWDSDLTGFGVKVSPAGRKSYVFRYRMGGGRGGVSREPVIGVHGKITPDEARRIARSWSAEVAAGRDPAASRRTDREAPRMGQLFERYLEEHARRHKKPSSVSNDVRMIKQHLKPALGAKKVADVTRQDVGRVKNNLVSTPYEANRSIALLSKMMNLAEAWDWRSQGSNPCQHVAKFKEQKRERFLSDDEFARLYRALAAAEGGSLRSAGGTAISPYAIAAIRLLILTGARRGEILGLRWDWIDREAGRAALPDSKTGRKTLYLTPEALSVLEVLSREEGNPHVIVGGKPGSHLVNLKDPWNTIRHAAGLDDVRLHDLRHAFASVAVSAGMSLPLLGALLGHRSPSTTARYAHLADDPQRQAAAAVSARISGAMQGVPSPSPNSPSRD